MKHIFLAAALCCTLHVFSAHAAEAVLRRADGAKVPVHLYGDWSARACPPTVILSPGLGANDGGLKYIGNILERNNYRVLVMGHQESGRQALRKTILSRDKTVVVLDQKKYDARFMDIQAAFDFATRSCRPALLALGGHSMGAATTMLEAGARGAVQNAALDRFDAYIALSPQGEGYMFQAGAWSGIRKPVLMVTGTEDSGFDGEYTVRLSAFEGLPPGKKRLAVIEGASHLNLGGLGNPRAQAITGNIILEYLNMVGSGAWAPSAIRNAQITDK